MVKVSVVIATIPKELGGDELVVLRKKDLETLISRAEQEVDEEQVLAWSRDAQQLHREGKLQKMA